MEKLNNLIIFEMANSHQGSVEHGLNIISEMGKIARKYNVRAAVKLQYRNLENFIHPDYVNKSGVPHVERFMSTRLKYDEFNQLIVAIKEAGMVAMVTPFDEDCVDWCVDQGVDIIKVASCSCMDWPLLEKIATAKKPIIISTGGRIFSDIDKIYNFFIHRNCEFAFMHCVAEYPVSNERIQLDYIDKMKKRYRDIEIGYSGHENPDDTLIPAMAVSKGVTLFERHVGLPTESIKLNAYSMNPEQADIWVKTIEQAKDVCSLKKENDKYVSQAEIDSLNSLMRGAYVKRDIQKGEVISREDIFFAMPCNDGQMTSGMFYDGVVATRDYKKMYALYEKKPVSDITLVRDVIHEAKGLLLEAGIVLGDSFEVELSHHYGVEHFRKVGAILISIINREYCKKLIIVLPGQSHPTHMHKVKEETFQVLYGDLEIEIEGKQREMKAGDLQTVLRNERHSFASRNGAIFEEVSTTHVVGDSCYDDPVIAKKDPIERKTFIKNW